MNTDNFDNFFIPTIRNPTKLIKDPDVEHACRYTPKTNK